MARLPKPFHLRAQHKKELKQLLSGGIQQVRVVLRALALLLLDEGMRAPKVSRTAPFAAQAIPTIAKRYQRAGLEKAWFERKWTGRAELLKASDKRRIIAMVCSQPPEGRARWTVRLVAEEAVKRKLVPGGPRNDTGLAPKPRLKAVEKKMWCVAELDEDYIAKMEDVLVLYEKPYRSAEPVICLDEKPVSLHDEVRPGRTARPGHIAKRDNEYKRCGTANVFAVVEPKAGRHFTCATPNRSAAQFAQVV